MWLEKSVCESIIVAGKLYLSLLHYMSFRNIYGLHPPKRKGAAVLELRQFMKHKEPQFKCHQVLFKGYDYTQASREPRRNAWLHLLGVRRLSIAIALPLCILRIPTGITHFL